jgi:hypothetical protein
MSEAPLKVVKKDDEIPTAAPKGLIDHLGFAVQPSKFEEVIAFYTAILEPLGSSLQTDFRPHAVGFGPSKQSSPFWIASKENAPEKQTVHLAFSAKTHEEVDNWHAAALKAGAKDNGKPGIRDYHPNYYAAFVIDPVG